MLDHPKRIVAAALAMAVAVIPCVPSSAAAADSGEIRVNVETRPSRQPALAVLPDGGFVVVWEASGGDVRARFFDHRGEPRGGEVSLAVTGTNVWHVDQAVADADGSFLLVWTGVKDDGRTVGIFVRRFRRDGTPRGKVIRASVPKKLARMDGVIAVSGNGSFAVAWLSEERFGGSGAGYTNAVGRVFAKSGRPSTPEIVLSAGYASAAGDDSVFDLPAALALAPDGTLSALVHSIDDRVSTFLVRLRPGDATPAVLGLSYRHSFVGYPLSRGSVAVGPEGGGIATWRDESLWGLRFAPDGTQRGDPIRLSAANTGTAQDPLAALQADGSFVAAWVDRTGVFARAFDANGNPRGGDFQVSTRGSQHLIGTAGRGPVIVVWVAAAADGVGADVFARVLPVGAIR